MAESIVVLYAAHSPSEAPGVRTLPPTAEALQTALDTNDQGALLVIGGDAFAPPLPWREWVRELPRHRPGLGEAVRRTLADQGHPGAALVAVEGGIEGGCIVLVAPDDAAVRDTALGVLSELSGASRLSVPALDNTPVVTVSPSEVVFEEDSDAPGTIGDPELAPPRVAQVATTVPPPASARLPAPDAQPGWSRALEGLGWRLDRDRWGQLPEELSRLAPVRQVLASAGERRLVLSDDGIARVACGFPDLRRADAKVLVVSIETDLDGNDAVGVLALHRSPSPTGTCSPAGTWTPASDLLPGPVCVNHTGRAPAIGGELFAVDGRTVYLKRGRAVVAWDGRNEQPMGTTSQALASLVLRWSQR